MNGFVGWLVPHLRFERLASELSVMLDQVLNVFDHRAWVIGNNGCKSHILAITQLYEFPPSIFIFNDHKIRVAVLFLTVLMSFYYSASLLNILFLHCICRARRKCQSRYILCFRYIAETDQTISFTRLWFDGAWRRVTQYFSLHA